MKCVTPMFRRYEKGDHSKGTVISRAEAMSELERFPNDITFKLEQYNKKSHKYGMEQIPCHKCWACQLNYSAEWATRLTLEAKKYEHNYFITLTYDDEHVPINDKIEYDQELRYMGEVLETERVTVENDGTWGFSLAPQHMVTFLNSLRKHLERNKKHKGVKYYYCGEYGETTHRPHYHIILLNCPLDISEFYDTHIDTNYKAHWKSHEIERYWKKGMIDIAECEWSCIAYVARYCTKKLDMSGDKRIYYNKGLIPEFVNMSKGIAFDYFRQHKDEIYKNDEMIMKTVKGNTGSFKPPKAFDRKFKETDPKGFELIRKSRAKAGERARKLEKSITDYTDLEMLKLKASNLQQKMSMLPRVGEW